MLFRSRLTGLIQRFERVNVGGEQWQAQVAMHFRLDREDMPLLQRTYRAEIPADGASIEATVRAFALAIDRCFSELRRDMADLAES